MESVSNTPLAGMWTEAIREYNLANRTGNVAFATAIPECTFVLIELHFEAKITHCILGSGLREWISLINIGRPVCGNKSTFTAMQPDLIAKDKDDRKKIILL